MTESARRMAVLGGGLSGLLAALRLQQLGVDVTLFEAASSTGGSVQSHRNGEWLVERGPALLTEPHAEVRPVLDSTPWKTVLLGASANSCRRYLLHRGTPVLVPTRVADLISSPLLSMSGRLRLVKEPFIERGNTTGEESVDAFVRRRLGPEVAERIIDPSLAGTNGGDPKQLLARYVLPRLTEYERAGGSILKGAMRARRNARRRGEGTGSWSCVDGLGQFIATLTAALGARVRPSSTVEGLRHSARGVEIAVAGDGTHAFDAAVVALPARALNTLGVDHPGFGTIAETPHASMAICALGFRQEDVGHPLDAAGLLVATTEQRRILGVTFSSSLFTQRAPDGHVLVTVYMGGARQPALLLQSDQELMHIAKEELRDMLQVRAEPVFQQLHRWEHQMPQMVAGHRQRLEAASAIEEALPRLTLSGGWRDGTAAGEAMLGGVRAAERLFRRLESTP